MKKNSIRVENNPNESNKPIETNSAEIVRRHLEDENHEITDDEIRNVKIATTGEELVTIGAEATSKLIGDESEFTDDENNDATDAPDPKAKPGTPWDVLSE